MNTKTESLDLLNLFISIYESAKDCKLEESYFRKIEGKLAVIAEKFHISPIQSFLLVNITVFDLEDKSVKIDRLSDYFGCNVLHIVQYLPELEDMSNKQLIKIDQRKYSDASISNKTFSISKDTLDTIIKNRDYIQPVKEEIKDAVHVLGQIFALVDKRDDEEIDTPDLFCEIEKLLELHQGFSLIKAVQNLQLDVEEKCILCYCIWQVLLGEDDIDISGLLSKMFDRDRHKVRYMQEIISKENPLLRGEWLNIGKGVFSSDSNFVLTDKTIALLKEHDIEVWTTQQNPDNVILPSAIPTRTLLFSEADQRQLTLLQHSLTDEHFRQMQQRLSERHLPNGITVLLHGGPGTGKTETVLQLARQTNRAILKVDISETKSSWFGESEKRIKKVFTQYRSFAEKQELKPILFFNEADAVIGKRKDSNSSNVAQTENAIQNIILDEIENFDGILIATTNLIKNLDTAFERRFLFKIQLNKPSAVIKAQIWKEKLPFLSKSSCQSLAQQYDFSGGQIDNIVRKVEIHQVIHNEKLKLSSIMEFCDTERWEATQAIQKIGFIH
ncbi:ATP-binding protein [Sphingobacterium thalpophilum]|uniref:ATP-binding protein n=1 Tax=Sphingobacterium thalpophilum TaxID=259 RepID=UPI003DA45956